MELCANHGVLVVAAAGNDGCPCLHVPAAMPSVLVVGAMDGRGEPLDSSNWGEAYRTHGVLAPGEQIEGAAPGGGTAASNGTSFATALVSGVAALLMSRRTATRSEEPRTRRPFAAPSSRPRSAVNNSPSRPASVCWLADLNITRSLHLLNKENSQTMSEENQTHRCPSESRTEPRPGTRRSQKNAARSAGDPPNANPPPAAAVRAAAPARSRAWSTPWAGSNYDFGTEARRDAFIQRGLANPQDAHRVAEAPGP